MGGARSSSEPPARCCMLRRDDRRSTGSSSASSRCSASFGFAPGLRRRRAGARRLRARRARRHAARPAAAAGRARARRTRRCSAWSARCCSAGVLASGFEGLGARLRRAADRPALGALDGLLGARADARRRARARLGAGAVALQTPGARACAREVQRSASCASSTRCCRRPGRCSTRWRASTRSRDRRPEARGRAARARRSRASRGVRGGGAERREDPRHRLRARRRGLRLGRGDGLVVTNAHVVAGQEDTRVLLRGRRGRRLRRDAVALRPAQRRRGAARARPRRRRRSTLAADPRSGTAAAILGFPRNGPYDVRGGPASARRAR